MQAALTADHHEERVIGVAKVPAGMWAEIKDATYPSAMKCLLADHEGLTA